WLIFGLPPAEVAVHPCDRNDVHELYLMCDDIQSFVAEMHKQNIVCDPIENQGWGLLTRVTLPGGGKLGVYEPAHARPASPSARAAKAKSRPPQKPKRAVPSKKRAR